jgi:hypothetical protein
MKLMRAVTVAGAAVAVAGLAIECLNLRRFRTLRPASGTARSIVACLAVRNEERTVADCIRALLAQPEIEAVAVCDDRSDDATPQIIERSFGSNPRVWVAQMPSGEGSKRDALRAAAARACACDIPYLLFTDADVTFDYGAAGALLECAREHSAQAVSAWPRVRVRGFADVLFGPLVVELLLQALPMWRTSDPRCAAGNGQAFLVERCAYLECGGHDGIGLVEDVALARRLRCAGFRVELGSAAAVATVDGYGSTRAAMDGLGRSLYAAGGVRACVAYALWHAALASTLLGFRIASRPALVAAIAMVAARALQAVRGREPFVSIALVHVSHAFAAFGAGRAAVLGALGRLTWRGRRIAV